VNVVLVLVQLVQLVTPILINRYCCGIQPDGVHEGV